MPGIMFQDVVSSRTPSSRGWYTVPLSFLVHTFVLATLIAVPLIATDDALPGPRALLQYMVPFVPVIPAAPAMRRATQRPAAQGTRGAPVVAPDVIGVEPGVIFEPDDVETAGIEGLLEGFGAAPVAVDAPPSPVVPSAPIIVGGHIRPPARTRYVAPGYPEIARAARVQGVVIIEAIIGADGKVEDARVLRSIALLDQAALAAVRAWEYTPTLLNGRPTAVLMTVTVQFSLK